MRSLSIILLCLGIWTGCFAGESQAKVSDPDRIYVEGTQFYRNGESVFFVGGNTPWDKWNDFGGGFNANFWENHFKALHDLGVNGSRVWIVCNGNSAVKLNPDGTVKSISNKFWTDLDQFFEIAKKNKIYIMATMMSFDCTKKGNDDRENWIAMIKNTNSISNFIDNYIAKFVKRYKDNPYLFSMDLCNEPDWIFEHDNISWEDLSNLFAREAVAIHENSKILVTVGIAVAKYNCDALQGNKVSNAFLQNLYKNPKAYLDFYSPHHYAWETKSFKNPFFVSPTEWLSDTSKPVVIGECSAKSCDGHTLAEDYIWAYTHGYAGVFPWTTNGVDANGGLEDVAKGVKGYQAWLAANASPRVKDQRTNETKIADIVMLLPAQDTEMLHRLMGELIQLDNVIPSLATKLLPAGEGNDSQLRYAISGLAFYASQGNNPADKQKVANALCKALSTVESNEIKDFLLIQLQYVAGDESVETAARYLENERLADPAARVLVRIGSDAAGKAMTSALAKNSKAQQIVLVQALGDMCYKPANKVIGKLSKTPDAKLRKVVLNSLAQIKGEKAVQKVQNTASIGKQITDKTAESIAIKDTSMSVAEELAIVREKRLLRKTPEQQLLILRDSLEIAQTSAHRTEIINQIAKTGTFLGMITAKKYINDSQEDVRQAAVQAVNTITKAHPEYSGFVSMFNGKDLTGWKGLVDDPIKRSKMTPAQLAQKQVKADEIMRQDWKVENGLLVYEGKGYENLCSVKKYGDIEMYVDWKIAPKGDAGIYLRGSPQVQIWDTSRVDAGAQVGSGGLYNNQKYESKPLVVADNPINEWNSFYIRMEGDKVTVYLNGQLVTDNVILENYWDRSLPIFPEEAIELQAHGNRVEYRDIYVREIPHPEPYKVSEAEKKEGFVPLFNGVNLTGWIGNLRDYYAKDGMIICDPKRGGHGNLYTEKEYSDFIIRFEFQLTPAANNGLGIRAPLEGDAAYVGMELQILDNDAEVYKDLHAYQYHGSVYGVIPAKRGFLKPVGEWNYQEVIAKGNRITITLNGTVILDGDIAEASKNFTSTIDGNEHPGLSNKQGHIGFLGHGSYVAFRNLRIKSF